MNVRVNNVDEGLGVSALTNGAIVAVGKEFMGLFPMPRQGDNAGTGVPPNLASSIEIHNMKMLANLGSDYITTDSFSTFITSGFTSVTFSDLPIGAFVWRTTTGNKYQKTSSTAMTARTLQNGSNVSTILGVTGNTLNYSARLNNHIRLNTTGNPTTAIVNKPLYNSINSIPIGAEFLIAIAAGENNITITWDTLYGLYNKDSGFSNLGTTFVPQQAIVEYKFRVVAGSAEIIRLQLVDYVGAGSGGSFTPLASNGLTMDGDTTELGGTLNANTTINLHGKTLTFDGQSISGSQLNVNNGGILSAQNLKLDRTNNSTGTAIINVTINPVTLTLPAGTNNLVKFIINNCGVTFTIDPNSTETIGGLTTMTLADGDAIIIVFNSTTFDWMIVSSDIAIAPPVYPVTGVDDQVNGHDLSMSGTLIRSAPNINELTSVTVATGDQIMIGDASDSFNPKKISAGSFVIIGTNEFSVNLTQATDGLGIYRIFHPFGTSTITFACLTIVDPLVLYHTSIAAFGNGYVDFQVWSDITGDPISIGAHTITVLIKK